MKTVLADGKYTVIFEEETGAMRAERYGQPWRDLTGDGMVLAMLQKIDELHNIIDRAYTHGMPAVFAEVQKLRKERADGGTKNLV